MVRSELRDLPEPNWFHHGVQVLSLLEEARPLHCVELGSNRGCSAIAVARLIRRWGGHLTCIDQWQEGPSEVELETFLQNIKAAGVEDTIGVIRAKTAETAEHWMHPIDYLYIDADHTVEGCTRDLEAWWPFLRVGGLIVGDDYDDPHGIPTQGVTQAWDDFEIRHGQAFARTVSRELLGCQCEPCKTARLIWGVKQ